MPNVMLRNRLNQQPVMPAFMGRSVMSRSVREQVLNVLNGYSADGKDRSASRIDGVSLQVAELATKMVVRLLTVLTQFMPEQVERDEVRTAIIFVVLMWLRDTSENSPEALHWLALVVERLGKPPKLH